MCRGQAIPGLVAQNPIRQGTGRCEVLRHADRLSGYEETALARALAALLEASLYRIPEVLVDDCSMQATRYHHVPLRHQ